MTFKPNSQGFTLIEILIALTIFAVLATITSSSLYYAFNTQKLVNIQSERLTEIQLALSIIQQDLSQVVDRPVRGNDMRLFPALIGRSDYLEFTRNGVVNPNSIEKRSALKRVALVCNQHSLVHRTWQTLDSIDRNSSQDKVLIDNLSVCQFNYLNQNLQSLPEWREQAVNQNQQPEPLPKAIQLNLKLKDWGEINLLYSIPGALYAPTQ